MFQLRSLTLTALLGVLAMLASAGQPHPDNVRVLLLTGGHGFNEQAFFGLFDRLDRVRYEHHAFPGAAELLNEQLADRFDVIVTYDMWNGPLTAEQKASYVGFVREGGGLVALHHALAAHQAWPEFHVMLGGRYFLSPQRWQGKRYPRGTPTHGQTVRVHVAEPDHPITRGIKDFVIHDETYKGYWVSKDVHQLLTTDHPKSEKVIGWCKRYGKGRVVYIQLGHGPEAYAHPAYQRLVRQAILWAAGSESSP